MTTKHTLAAAAIAGLLTGVSTTFAASTASSHAGVKISVMDDQAPNSGKGTDQSCKGKTSCKGKSGCPSGYQF